MIVSFRCHNSFVVNRHNIESIDSKERIVYFKNKEHCYASVRNVKKYNKIIKSVNGVFNCKSCWILTRSLTMHCIAGFLIVNITKLNIT